MLMTMATGTLPELLDQLFRALWDTYKADPDVLAMHTATLEELTYITLAGGYVAGVVSGIETRTSDTGALEWFDVHALAWRRQLVHGITNRITGTVLRIQVSDRLAPGTIRAISTTIPACYPGTDPFDLASITGELVRGVSTPATLVLGSTPPLVAPHA